MQLRTLPAVKVGSQATALRQWPPRLRSSLGRSGFDEADLTERVSRLR